MDQERYRFSRYLRTRLRGDQVAIFHELKPQPVFCAAAEWRSFKRSIATQRAGRLFLELKSRGLLVKAEQEDDAAYREALSKVQAKFHGCTILYLLMSQGCNCSCSYCPVPELSQRYGSNLLIPEDAIAGYELWRHHAEEDGLTVDRYLIFYGGEPLLNKPGISSVLRYLAEQRERGDWFSARVKLLLITNGVLLDEAVIQQCLDYGIGVAVGIDGLTDEMNALRSRGDSTVTKGAIEAIQRLVERGIATYASVTVTPANVAHVPRYIQVLGDLGVKKVGFNFMRGVALRELLPPKEIPTFMRQAARAVVAATVQARDCSPDYQMEKKILAMATGDFFPHDCTCYGNQLVVLADGQLSNCPFSGQRFGHVREADPGFRIWDVPSVQRLRQRSPLTHQAYRDLDFKALCGAGCAWGSWETTGDALAPDEGSIVFSEESFDHLLWEGAPNE